MRCLHQLVEFLPKSIDTIMLQPENNIDPTGVYSPRAVCLQRRVCWEHRNKMLAGT